MTTPLPIDPFAPLPTREDDLPPVARQILDLLRRSGGARPYRRLVHDLQQTDLAVRQGVKALKRAGLAVSDGAGTTIVRLVGQQAPAPEHPPTPSEEIPHG